MFCGFFHKNGERCLRFFSPKKAEKILNIPNGQRKMTISDCGKIHKIALKCGKIRCETLQKVLHNLSIRSRKRSRRSALDAMIQLGNFPKIRRHQFLL